MIGRGPRKRFLYVAIDRASRMVHLAVKDEETEACASAFLKEALAAFPFVVTHILTDNGSCFTADAFKSTCRALGIEHRRTKPRTPRTNGMVERFNGCIGREVLIMCVGTHDALERLLQGYNLAYNARRQRVLNGRSPDDVVRERLREKPQLANPAYHPPDPSHVAAVTAEAQRAVISAKEVSQLDSYGAFHLEAPLCCRLRYPQAVSLFFNFLY